MNGFSKAQTATILTRDGGICLMWGSNPFCSHVGTVANHRIDRGNGGSKTLNILVNGCAICVQCNGLIETDPVLADEARRRGVKVRRAQNITQDLLHLVETPLLHPVLGAYFLDEDGNRLETP